MDYFVALERRLDINRLLALAQVEIMEMAAMESLQNNGKKRSTLNLLQSFSTRDGNPGINNQSNFSSFWNMIGSSSNPNPSATNQDSQSSVIRVCCSFIPLLTAVSNIYELRKSELNGIKLMKIIQ